MSLSANQESIALFVERGRDGRRKSFKKITEEEEEKVH